LKVFNRTVYLGVTIDDGDPATADIEMRPRQAIVPVISAILARNSDKLNGADWSDLLVSGNDPSKSKIRRDKVQLDFDEASFAENGPLVKLKLKPPIVPVGTVIAFAGDKVPEGWLECNGDSIPQDPRYDSLRELIGQRVPDLRGRYVLGAGTGADLTPRTLMQTLGHEQQTLILENLPPHHHEVMGSVHPNGRTGGGGLLSPSATGSVAGGASFGFDWEYKGSLTSTTPAAAPTPFEIVPPSIVLKYLIRY
jgi:microcystin-dependent protein